MEQRGRGPVALIGGLAVAAVTVVAAIVAFTVHARKSHSEIMSQAQPPAATQPMAATRPATRPVHSEPKFEKAYLDVVRAEYPTLPTTQPLAFPLELNQSARLTLRDPLYLGSAPRTDLWITRADAPPIQQVLKEAVDPKASDPQTHVLRERVAFVHWMPTESGPWLPYIVCAKGGGFEVISEHGSETIPGNRQYLWQRAFSWNDKVVVPSRTGISVFEFGPKLSESYHELVPSADTGQSNYSEPLALLDWQGLLAWMPWEQGKTGGRGAARYLNGSWADLGSENQWPQKIVHLVPLLDGSVMQFVLRDDGMTGVEMGSLDRAPVDEKTIADLVTQLSDVDQDVRQKAFGEITRYGPGAWPMLEKLMNDQPPQAQLLLRQLLRDKQRPTLSGMTLLGHKSLQLVSRLSDSGVVFYVDQGVMMPGPDGEPTTTAPAWISIRPGDYARLLSPMMVVDLKPSTVRLDAVGDYWIVNTDTRGPRLFFGNGFATLLRKDERQFDRVIGMDGRGRWLFRKPDAGVSPATAPSGTETLIIDPHLPDLVPQFPVWQLAIADTVGWDKDNWPAVKRGGAFALGSDDWRAIAPDEKIFTKPQDVPPTTLPATRPSSQPTTDEADASPPILVTADGTRYYGGQTELKVLRPNGKRIEWTLPGDCVGNGKVTLIRTKDGKLFLFNQPGRVLRIAPTPGGSEPFKREATFTRNIPNTDKVTRIWLDPAGRIDIAWGSRLAICFPEGFIPRAILDKMVDQSGFDADSP